MYSQVFHLILFQKGKFVIDFQQNKKYCVSLHHAKVQLMSIDILVDWCKKDAHNRVCESVIRWSIYILCLLLIMVSRTREMEN